jgi:hypothetical protein
LRSASLPELTEHWLVRAWNEGQPRFTGKMGLDETEAGNSNLGTDLQTLDANLQTLNSAALMPSPPGFSPATGLGALQQDCTAYGVNVHEPGG